MPNDQLDYLMSFAITPYITWLDFSARLVAYKTVHGARPPRFCERADGESS